MCRARVCLPVSCVDVRTHTHPAPNTGIADTNYGSSISLAHIFAASARW